MKRSPRFRTWLLALRPGPLPAPPRDILRISLGATLGIGLTALLMRGLAAPLQMTVWMVAPLGASAVLVFAVPTSPLAQPYAVVAGNTLSALVGLACAALVPDMSLAAALAVGVAIALMCVCRCLHPPGGAMALLMVLNQVGQWRFALLPVCLDALLLVVVGMLWHPLAGRSYPSRLST